MKYRVTGYASDWVEIEAGSEAEAEQIGKERLGRPSYYDDYEVEEMEDE